VANLKNMKLSRRCRNSRGCRPRSLPPSRAPLFRLAIRRGFLTSRARRGSHLARAIVV